MITELTDALRKAKFAEATAKAERLRLEELIEKQFTKPDGGEGSHTDEEVKITWKINRTVDTTKVQAHGTAWARTPRAPSAGKPRLTLPICVPSKIRIQQPTHRPLSSSPANLQNPPLNF